MNDLANIYVEVTTEHFCYNDFEPCEIYSIYFTWFKIIIYKNVLIKCNKNIDQVNGNQHFWLYLNNTYMEIL